MNGPRAKLEGAESRNTSERVREVGIHPAQVPVACDSPDVEDGVAASLAHLIELTHPLFGLPPTLELCAISLPSTTREGAEARGAIHVASIADQPVASR